MLAVLACGPLDSVMETVAGDDANFTNVSELWSDVPRMEGLTASEVDMPASVKFIARTIIGNLGLLNPEGEDRTTGKVDWIVFETGKSGDDVKAFYTPERMTENGWAEAGQSPCLQGSDFGVADVGALCVFEKRQGEAQTQLAIVVARDEQAQKNYVFFLRLETVATPAPEVATPQPAVSLVEVKPGMDVSALNVCDLLPAAEVEKALGRKLVSAPQPFSFNGANTDSACSYDAGKDGSGNAYYAYAVVAPTEDYAANRPDRLEPVAGLGDEAFFVNGPDARQLWVLLNGRAAVMVAIGEKPNEAGAKALASILLTAINR
jgi:hypothetical protein